MELTRSQKEAVERLYIEMYYPLSGYAFSVLGSRALAEDVVQETFRIACTRVDAFLASPNPRGWLVVVLKNVIGNAISRQRRLNVILSTERECEMLPGSPDVDIPPGVLLAGPADDGDLHLLHRVAVDGYSVAEAARELGISTDACKKRIQRAKARLRKKLQDDI